MLEHLRVANLGVLDDVSIDPSPGFTVITGETGAGKTLLLGGLRLILGGGTDPRAVGPYDSMATVDGLFSIGEDEIGASRTVPSDGRSRARIDGAIVSVATLVERLGSLVEIVGQHDQLSLARPSRLLALVDSALDESGEAARLAYIDVWNDLQRALERQGLLGGDPLELTRELDLARYQSTEIAASGLSPGLDSELETRLSRLRNAEEITQHLAETLQLSESLSESVGEVVSHLRKATELDTTLADLSAEGDLLASGIAELARGVRSTADDIETDSSALQELEDRLTALGDLKRKYGRTIEEVIAYGDRIDRRAVEIESVLADADRIEEQIAECRSTLSKAGDILHRARRGTARHVTDATLTHLADLGLGGARIEIDVEQTDSGPGGADRVEMRFASDKRLEPGPVGDVASGGELSRLVLALRLATRDSAASTLVFDEVDTGIGGATALAMGEKLAALASDGQILCVTHLAQVAAHADRHYVVERGEDGRADIRRVDGDDRIVELARMLAGQPESEAGRSAAAELLAGARK